MGGGGDTWLRGGGKQSEEQQLLGKAGKRVVWQGLAHANRQSRPASLLTLLVATAGLAQEEGAGVGAGGEAEGEGEGVAGGRETAGAAGRVADGCEGPPAAKAGAQDSEAGTSSMRSCWAASTNATAKRF